MAPAQPGSGDVAEALTDDVVHRQQGWKPGEKELMTRQTDALEKAAKALAHLADYAKPPASTEPPPPEGQPKEGKPK